MSQQPIRWEHGLVWYEEGLGQQDVPPYFVSFGFDNDPWMEMTENYPTLTEAEAFVYVCFSHGFERFSDRLQLIKNEDPQTYPKPFYNVTHAFIEDITMTRFVTYERIPKEAQ